MIFRTPFVLPILYPQLVWRIATTEKKIFLTFDDGPVPEQTEFVLNTLSRFHARATFFCIGDNVKKYPHVFQQVVANGHSFGNHTFNHLKGWGNSTKDYVENVERCEMQFIEQSQPNMNLLFRPPYGRITRNQIKALNSYRIMMWDVLTYDYSSSCSPERCLRGSIQATRPGSIVVFHDSVKAYRNMSFALPRFLEHFSEQGYSFEVL